MKDYINLIPAELVKKRWLSKEIIIALGIAGVFVIFAALYGTLFYKVRTLKAEKNQLTVQAKNNAFLPQHMTNAVVKKPIKRPDNSNENKNGNNSLSLNLLLFTKQRM